MRGLLVSLLCLCAPGALAAELVFDDPAGDDFGAGAVVYPTDPVYIPGSFDLRRLVLRDLGDAVEIQVQFEGAIQDPWDSRAWGGNGFSLQMVQVYLDTAPDQGFTEALPGLHAGFAPADAWDRVVLIAPQGAPRLRAEIDQRAGAMQAAIVLPRKVSATERGLVAVVDRRALGGALSPRWGVQAAVASSEPFPEAGNLMARRVNETAGAHRFGGGRDDDCDPNVIDILTLAATGAPEEVAAQKAALAYECGPGQTVVRAAILPMIRREALPAPARAAPPAKARTPARSPAQTSAPARTPPPASPPAQPE